MKQFPARGSISRLFLFFLIAAAMPAGCAYYAGKPLETLYYSAGNDAPPKNLFVFMRGLGGSHRSFEKEGLVEAVRKRGAAFDMAAPNAHFAYYAGRTLIERLREDVILPAKRKGYENIWLIGFSMGGLGSLLYLREHPEDIEGIYLISPFLGYGAIVDEIDKSGGLPHWMPGDYSPEDDWERMLWHWIKTRVAGDNSIPIHLGFGADDPYAKAQRLLAAALPEEHVTLRKGGHDYETFKALWLNFLERGVYSAR